MLRLRIGDVFGWGDSAAIGSDKDMYISEPILISELTGVDISKFVFVLGSNGGTYVPCASYVITPEGEVCRWGPTSTTDWDNTPVIMSSIEDEMINMNNYGKILIAQGVYYVYIWEQPTIDGGNIPM